MGNLSSIGFEVHDYEAFQRLAEMVYQKGNSIRAGEGFYVQSKDDSGAELWLQLDRERSIIGLNPHFGAKNQLPLELLEGLSRPESPMDGAFKARLAGQPDTEFVFDLPDAHCTTGIALPSRSEVALVGFAEELAEEEGQAVGMHAVGEGKEAVVEIVGEVRNAAFKINGWTGRAFLWLELEMDAGKIELVAASKLWKGLPPEGTRLKARAWLSGRVDPEKVQRPYKGFFERLFWGAQ